VHGGGGAARSVKTGVVEAPGTVVLEDSAVQCTGEDGIFAMLPLLGAEIKGDEKGAEGLFHATLVEMVAVHDSTRMGNFQDIVETVAHAIEPRPLPFQAGWLPDIGAGVVESTATHPALEELMGPEQVLQGADAIVLLEAAAALEEGARDA
jgi:hypothetical protein